MSRETDSSSSGPQGRGGAAYPSGTPPYGTRQYPSPQEEQFGGDTGDSAASTGQSRPPVAPGEPRTETRLTTRVRINIPGSRPIPPVVLRTAVPDSTEGRGTRDDATPPAPAPAPRETATNDATQAMPRWTPSGGSPSDGAPSAPDGGTLGGGSFGGGPLDGGTLGGGTLGGGTLGGGTPPPPAAGGGPGGPPPSDWFSPRRPQAGPGEPPTAPGGQSTPPFGLPAEPDAQGTPPGGTSAPPPMPNIPYLTESPTPPPPPPPAPGGTRFDEPPAAQDTPGVDLYGLEAPPTDPYGGMGGLTAGLGTGTDFGRGGDYGQGTDLGRGAAPGTDPVTGLPSGQGAAPRQDSPTGNVPFTGFHTPDPARPHLDGAEPPTGPDAGPAGMTGPAGAGAPDARSGYRPPRAGRGTGAPPGPGSGPGHVSGDTLVSGVPRVPSGLDSGAPAAPEPSSSSARPRRKGRSKLVLAAGGLVTVAVVAYGAGLLMDHAAVPNGTTVLGVNIGGDSKEAATKALDAAVKDRSDAPLSVEAGGRVTRLRPEVAGLAIDPDATIREVVHHDYNPVSVIGSLLGGTHEVAPVFTIDQAKLRSQLQTVAAGGTGSDGMVKFVAGTPVAVQGRPYQAVDADAAVRKIVDAYEQRADAGSTSPVALPVGTHQPQVTRAALEQAIKRIGDPAMSGRITVVAGSRQVPFSPQKSLSKILTIVPVPGTGTLTLHIDLTVLQSLYGNAFQGVLLERGNGSKTPVTPQDVASAMLPELSKTEPVKTAVISNVAP